MKQEQVVEALMNVDAYEEDVDTIELIQTHISFIFLAKRFVYKVKKAVDLGFLDFTTLEKRRFFCEEELRLNRRLCADMYLEVVRINKSDIVRIGGDGETVEYAVKMKRMPQEKMLNRILEEGKADESLIDEIARIIAEFHRGAETDDEIRGFGSIDIVGANWKENFDQTQEFVGRAISSRDYEFIRQRIYDFMTDYRLLFEARMEKYKIRECHGDIHSGNIFVTERIYIFDAIEFNERFRYSDTASDVAFLAMDLDFKGEASLSKFLVERYIEYSGDTDLLDILPFYKCYRAYVRGKVAGFRIVDPNMGIDEKKKAREEARAYFALASDYAETLHQEKLN